MPPVLTDNFQPPRRPRRVLADLAIGVLVVVALALITSFIAATSAPL
ncbi:hypothetical protein QTI24_03230 [Variovorax sp. J22P240]|nr:MULTISPECIES: hypothetical protein [unclassified Variovorax]MDL9997600.1 hypothetical protein [Variovorax sp. J22P240]MDM0051637.1 hypothetical protein [Variovorax sp. J22R115]